jgi:E3 ubiquitin-protein ligase synoviolin
MGRLFGPPAHAPLPPGQAPLLHQRNVIQNPGTLAGQAPQGVVIQYHIQYHIPRLPAQQHPPGPLHNAPPFPGFPGPDGVWQRWPGPMEQQNIPPPPEPALGNSTQPGIPPPPPSSSTSEQSAPPVAAPTPEQSNVTSNSNSESTNPREAAALAALRRLNNGGSSGTSNPARDDGPTMPRDATSQPSRSANSSIGDRSTHNSFSDQSADVPSLIPLYDYGFSGYSNQEASATIPRSGAMHSTSSRTTTEINQHVTIDTSPQRNSQASSQQLNPNSSGSRYEHTSDSDPQVPISHLPPTLTSEQLAIMDRVTREAIDERLRVLEGVSGAVYRCIDDLMRMRSSLPSPTPTQTPQPPPVNLQTNADNSSRPTLTTLGLSGGPPDRQVTNEEPGPSNALSAQHEEES